MTDTELKIKEAGMFYEMGWRDYKDSYSDPHPQESPTPS